MTTLLFSGGVDSLALAWWRRPDWLLTVDYGQVTAESEVEVSSVFAGMLGIRHDIVRFDLSSVGSGTLAGRGSLELSSFAEWWPYRNQFLITIGAAWSLGRGVDRLWIGTVKSDACFADGTPAFIDGMNRVVSMQEGAVVVEAPASALETWELVEKSGLPLDYLLLCHTCTMSVKPCGHCRSCGKHRDILERFSLI
jgi:7-cyano-7-deazaguanine synthase